MVAVIDAWTSPRGNGAERRNVFGVGERLQFNGLFVTERDTPSRVRILFVIDSQSNIVATDEGHDFELGFKPQLVLEAEFTVGPEAQRPYVNFLIPETDLGFHWRGRQNTAYNLVGGYKYIFAKTLYNFRIMVRLLDVATGQPFDLSDTWTYGITD